MSEKNANDGDSFQKAVNVVGQILDNELESNHINTLLSHYQNLCQNKGQVVWPEKDDVTSEDVKDAMEFLNNNGYDSLCNHIKSYQGLYIPSPE